MKNLTKLRKAAGFSQLGLAKKSGVQRWKICHAEHELATFTPEERSRVLVALSDAVKRNLAAVIQASEDDTDQ